MNFAIILAAGKGKRMESDVNKVLLEIKGKPILYHTLKKFEDCTLIHEITVVAQKKDFKKIGEIKKHFTKIKKVIEGGEERQDSVFNGFRATDGKEKDMVIIHNGSNPFAKIEEIEKCVEAAKSYGAAVCAYPLKDTIKRIKHGFVEATIPREGVYQMQTPQCIQYGILEKAFENAKKKNLKVTDDVMLVEALGKKVKIVECSYQNFKITTPSDLETARGIMGKEVRTGFGQDSHSFSRNKKKKLVLGGYQIDHAGFEANSDGDVILHALFNSISQAIGGRSLGITADSMFKSGITDSREYLYVILKEMKKRGFEINNAGIMIEAGKPKLEPHSEKIKESLSKILGIEKEKIGLTFTSGENLTSFGKGLGMQCFAVVTLD